MAQPQAAGGARFVSPPRGGGSRPGSAKWTVSSSSFDPSTHYRHILPCLMDNGIKLEEVDLSSREVGVEGSREVASALKNNRTCHNLLMNRCMLGKEGLNNLCAAFRVNLGVVSTLEICGNELGKEGARILADCLRTNTTLTSVNLSENNIGKEGARWMADMLEVNKTLKNLNVRSNYLSKEGGLAIGNALNKNRSLSSLNIVNNAIGKDAAEAIINALKTNDVLVSMNLVWNGIGEDTVELINGLLRRNKKRIEENLAGGGNKTDDDEDIPTLDTLIERLKWLDSVRRQANFKHEADVVAEMLYSEIDQKAIYERKLSELDKVFDAKANDDCEQKKVSLKNLETKAINFVRGEGVKHPPPPPEKIPLSPTRPKAHDEVAIPLPIELEDQIPDEMHDEFDDGDGDIAEEELTEAEKLKLEELKYEQAWISLASEYGMDKDDLETLADLAAERDGVRSQFKDTLDYRLRRLKELQGLRDDRQRHLEESAPGLLSSVNALLVSAEESQQVAQEYRERNRKANGRGAGGGGGGGEGGGGGGDETGDANGDNGGNANGAAGGGVKSSGRGKVPPLPDIDPMDRLEHTVLVPRYQAWHQKFQDGPLATKYKHTEGLVNELYKIASKEASQLLELIPEGKDLSKHLAVTSTVVSKKMGTEDPQKDLDHLIPLPDIHTQEMKMVTDVTEEQKEVRRLINRHQWRMAEWLEEEKCYIRMESDLKILELEVAKDDQEVIDKTKALEEQREKVNALTKQKEELCRRLAVLGAQKHPELRHSTHAHGCVSCREFRLDPFENKAEADEEPQPDEGLR